MFRYVLNVYRGTLISFVCVHLTEDRFLTTLSSQSSTSSSLLQLPTPPEVVSDQLTGGTMFASALAEADTASSSEGIIRCHLPVASHPFSNNSFNRCNLL